MSDGSGQSVEELLAEIARLSGQLEEATTLLSAMSAENGVLARLVEELQRRIVGFEHQALQSSKNSSLPPSSDGPKDRAEATKTRADRRAAEKAEHKDEVQRRRGKQPGSPGKNLAMRADPDFTFNWMPPSCDDCGCDLGGIEPESFERRQVHDTPQPIIVCTEHRAFTKRCGCGKLNKGVFPTEAIGSVCYGPNIRSHALYFNYGQFLSVERTTEAMSEVLGVSVSTGFVAQLGPEAASRLSGFTDVVRQRLIDAPIVHADETSDQVGTKKWWLHTVATDLYTYLIASHTRGKAAPDEAGVLAEFTGVMVHDRLGWYFNYDQAKHAICLAHIIRELDAVGVGWDQGWAKDMSRLITEMITATHEASDKGRAKLPRRQLQDFLARYDANVEAGLAVNPAPVGRPRDTVERKSFNLATALKSLKPEATLFAKDLSVPATNNLAERSLRMAKIHSKISNCFMGEDNARAFATVRSYISTARKHGVGGLDVLVQLFRGEAWVPPLTT